MNAAELVADQKSFVPVDDGDLRDSIGRSPLSSGRIGQVVFAGGPTTTRPVRSGVSVTYDYALAQEFGRFGQHPNPFFYPAYRFKKRRFKSRITREVKKAILAMNGK